MSRVDAILKVFLKTADALEREAERLNKKGVKSAEKILKLRDKRDEAYNEAGRALNASSKIRRFFED